MRPRRREDTKPRLVFFVLVLIRSIVAAVGSGIAFYAISDIWFPFNPHGWDYAVHFVSWTAACLPAFAALLVSRRLAWGCQGERGDRDL